MTFKGSYFAQIFGWFLTKEKKKLNHDESCEINQANVVLPG